MRRLVCPLLCVLLAVAPCARAEDDADAEATRAAILVRTAFDAGDADWLRDLARGLDPDPWLVADRLAAGGASAAATAYAEAAPRPDVASLPFYIEELERQAPAERARLAALRTALDLGGAPQDASGHASVPDVLALVTRAGAVAAAAPAEALALLREASLRCERLEWWAQGAFCLRWAAGVATACGRPHEALDLRRRLLAVQRRRQDAPATTDALLAIAETLAALGRDDEALQRLSFARGVARAAGLPGPEAAALRAAARLHRAGGRLEAARHALEAALGLAESLGEGGDAAGVLQELGALHAAAQEHDRAIARWKAALESPGTRSDPARAAALHEQLAGAYRAVGRRDEEAAALEAGTSAWSAAGDAPGQARCTCAHAALDHRQGRCADALTRYERARDLWAQAGRVDEVARTELRMANVYLEVGDREQARRCFERAHAHFDASRSGDELLATLQELSDLCFLEGDGAGALRCAEQAAFGARACGDEAAEGRARMNLGLAHLRAGRQGPAREALVAARDLFDRADDPRGRAQVQLHLGDLERSLGDAPRALRSYGRAQYVAESEGIMDVLAQAHWRLAEQHLLGGDPGQAVDAARVAVSRVGLLLRGFSPTRGAVTGASYAGLYEVGAGAALALDDIERVSMFLEAGRAGALLEMLGNAETLERAFVPRALRTAREDARRDTSAATNRLRQARERGGLVVVRERRRALEAAQAREAEIQSRIDREQRAGEALLHEDPDALAVIRGRLGPREMLVVYGRAVLPRGSPAALVPHEIVLRLTRTEARVVVLGTSAALAPVLAALAGGPGAEAEPVSQGLLDAARRAFVAPVEVPAAVERVLVAPGGGLALAPPALLFPDKEIAFVPSGTAYGALLRARGQRGVEVLALGDPAHPERSRASARVARLPGSRAEAEAIGDRLLLGADATKARLFELLEGEAGRHWRAVHLACHGFVNHDDPLQSWLALTPGRHDDGCLTMLEVFQVRLSADCVTLSACESGAGRLVAGGDLLGLARAFMLAGAPRVIVSLWRVDDQAARALMTRFYALWNPRPGPDRAEPGKTPEPLGAAAALRAAQTYVRAQAQWSHPYYWAGWVLWGLPD